MTDFKFQDGARVKLADHIDPNYYNGMAKSGNEGWITQHRVDRNGLPEAYIQWDRLHWADNKQPDGWTYEEHFEAVEENMEFNEDQMKELRQAYTTLQNVFGGSAPAPQPQPESTEKIERHKLIMSKATEALDDSESFIVVLVKREPSEEVPGGKLSVSVFGNTLSPDAEIVMGMQLGNLANQFHQETGLVAIGHLNQADQD